MKTKEELQAIPDELEALMELDKNPPKVYLLRQNNEIVGYRDALIVRIKPPKRRMGLFTKFYDILSDKYGLEPDDSIISKTVYNYWKNKGKNVTLEMDMDDKINDTDKQFDEAIKNFKPEVCEVVDV